MDLKDCRRLFDYDAWANCESLACLPSSGLEADRHRKLLAHVIGVQWLWMNRMLQKPLAMPVWPDLSSPECDAQLIKLAAAWRDFLASRSLALTATVRYTNSIGEEWSSQVADILTHVVLHGAYHRGQIASLVRAAGCEPAYTDFIRAVRQRKI